MTIIDFYKKLSQILTDVRENFLSQNQGKKKLEELINLAKDNNLDVKVNSDILDPINLMRLDDENSFGEEDEDTSFFDSETGFSY